MTRLKAWLKKMDAWFYLRSFLVVSFAQAAIACASYAGTDYNADFDVSLVEDASVVTTDALYEQMGIGIEEYRRQTKGRSIGVTGTIAYKTTGFVNEPVVALDIAGKDRKILASIAQIHRRQAESLNIGDNAFFVCSTLDSFKGSALLWSCKIGDLSDRAQFKV